MSQSYCSPAKWSIYQDRQSLMEDETCGQVAEKLRQAQHLLMEVGRDNNLEGLKMIDAIQRLGIEYYFEKEIQQILDRQLMLSKVEDSFWNVQDIHKASLRFRLLRQQGHHVPIGVLGNLKDNEGKFNPKLRKDIKGLMGLYEASQLTTQEEEDQLLVDAGQFSDQILHAWLNDDDDEHKARAMIRHTLRFPFHKSLAKFSAKEFIPNFHGTSEWINVLKEVAILDYSTAKSIHQKEIQHVSEWWEGLCLGKELNHARSNIVKWHMWSMAVLTDPRLSQQRIELTKPISLVYIIDDIFDVYGTLDQLTLFTQVVKRWEYAAIKELPEYMQKCVKVLFDTTREISNKIYLAHGWNPIQSLQNAWKKLCDAFLVEAKWFATGHMPSADEYLKNGIVSSGVHVPLLHIFFLLGQNITTETVQFADNFPRIISSTAAILRLWDDLGSAKDENQDGKDGSYIDYYMKEHEETSVESARNRVVDMISDSWKCLNLACLRESNMFSPAFTRACLNTARMVPLMCAYDEKKNLPSLNEYMKSLLAP